MSLDAYPNLPVSPFPHLQAGVITVHTSQGCCAMHPSEPQEETVPSNWDNHKSVKNVAKPQEGCSVPRPTTVGTIVTPRSEGAPGHTWVSIPKESEIDQNNSSHSVDTVSCQRSPTWSVIELSNLGTCLQCPCAIHCSPRPLSSSACSWCSQSCSLTLPILLLPDAQEKCTSPLKLNTHV